MRGVGGMALELILALVRWAPLPRVAKVLLAYLLVRLGLVSVGYAAAVCGMRYREYIAELRRRGLKPFVAHLD